MNKRKLFGYGIATIIAGLFTVIYNHYGHGVTSVYMNIVYLGPLVGAILYSILVLCKKVLKREGALLLYASIITLTVANLLNGIFEIAGTSSPYTKYFYMVGSVFFCGAMIYFFCCLSRTEQ